MIYRRFPARRWIQNDIQIHFNFNFHPKKELPFWGSQMSWTGGLPHSCWVSSGKVGQKKPKREAFLLKISDNFKQTFWRQSHPVSCLWNIFKEDWIAISVILKCMRFGEWPYKTAQSMCPQPCHRGKELSFQWHSSFSVMQCLLHKSVKQLF